MTIHFVEEQWYLGLFYVCPSPMVHDATSVDWLGTAWRPVEGGLWTICYRFGSPEEKRWWQGTCPAETNEHQMMTAMHTIMAHFEAEWAGMTDEVLLRCPGDAVGDKLLAANRAWIHMDAEGYGDARLSEESPCG